MACVNEESHKGEDYWTVQSAGSIMAYAVFDGHGGKHCAQFCASEGPEGVLPRLLQKGTLPTSTEIEDVFWQVDAECGPEMAERGGHGRSGGGAHAGSTSNVLFVEALPSKPSKASSQAPATPRPGGYKCIWAWTGDSTGITVDMASGKLGPCTPNHVPENPVEFANLRLMETVGKALLKGKGKDKDKDKGEKKDKKSTKKKGGDDDVGVDISAPSEAEMAAAASGAPVATAAAAAPAAAADEDDETDDSPISLSDVLAAIKATGVKPTPTCSAPLLLRALERERLIARSIPKGRKYRRNAVMQRRPKAKDENEPMVVATHEDPYSSHYRDLLMTRSICDWTKSSWVLPHPETMEFAIPYSKRFRVVLASDGLWDICSAERAAEVVFEADTVQTAAELLLEIAQRVYHGERGLEKMGDDTTVLVLELNPSGMTAGSATKGAAGGCLVS
jgi:serine/threonine protein phosphatase PrpC